MIHCLVHPVHIRVGLELNYAVLIELLELFLDVLKISVVLVGQDHVIRQAVVGHVKDDVPEKSRVEVSELGDVDVSLLLPRCKDDGLDLLEDLLS